MSEIDAGLTIALKAGRVPVLVMRISHVISYDSKNWLFVFGAVQEEPHTLLMLLPVMIPFLHRRRHYVHLSCWKGQLTTCELVIRSRLSWDV